MNSKERRKEIIEILNGLGDLNINFLKNKFNVSEMTIYRDIQLLEEKGLLKKITSWSLGEDIFVHQVSPFFQRVKININAKKAIAKKALEFINDDNSLFIDGGSTNFLLVKEINNSKLKKITVITNNIISQLELSKNQNIEVIATGGNIIEEYSCVGIVTEKILDVFNADIAFITSKGISEDGKLFTPNINEGKVKELFIKRAIKKILIVDSTKFGIMGLYNFADINDFDMVITDRNIPSEFLKMLNGADLITEIVDV